MEAALSEPPTGLVFGKCLLPQGVCLDDILNNFRKKRIKLHFQYHVLWKIQGVDIRHCVLKKRSVVQGGPDMRVKGDPYISGLIDIRLPYIGHQHPGSQQLVMHLRIQFPHQRGQMVPHPPELPV